MVKEMGVREQRNRAVLLLTVDSRGVGEFAAHCGVSRQSVQPWLHRYEDRGLEGLDNRCHKPKSIPHQMPAPVRAAILELRREQSSWSLGVSFMNPQNGVWSLCQRKRARIGP